jgi:hypothetical protein
VEAALGRVVIYHEVQRQSPALRCFSAAIRCRHTGTLRKMV